MFMLCFIAFVFCTNEKQEGKQHQKNKMKKNSLYIYQYEFPLVCNQKLTFKIIRNDPIHSQFFSLTESNKMFQYCNCDFYSIMLRN